MVKSFFLQLYNLIFNYQLLPNTYRRYTPLRMYISNAIRCVSILSDARSCKGCKNLIACSRGSSTWKIIIQLSNIKRSVVYLGDNQLVGFTLTLSSFSGISSSSVGCSKSGSVCCRDLLCCSFFSCAWAACCRSSSAFLRCFLCLFLNFFSSDGARFSAQKKKRQKH